VTLSRKFLGADIELSPNPRTRGVTVVVTIPFFVRGKTYEVSRADAEWLKSAIEALLK
jgi:hypothetical protein